MNLLDIVHKYFENISCVALTQTTNNLICLSELSISENPSISDVFSSMARFVQISKNATNNHNILTTSPGLMVFQKICMMKVRK